ncbi:MAG: Co2+/Mg2+ efflux protein ApaG [Candidatus Polarisedimenticolaceae bacterium]|nr:Co2+/Mg2+ efflux protein ApaG [Candidatus Polarisedimenticolaceae bacterium]
MNQDNPQKIQIEVESLYLSAESEPEINRYVFSYTITILNNGSEAAKLLDRHWIITDANGNKKEVKGKGVIGEQPHLAPGETFRYTSGAVLETPLGSMQGSYSMINDDGRPFLAEIPVFSLSKPGILH